ncbi:hypothetical protein PL373_14615 [Tenacibaculum maritimum]|nr:hypothetical protein [Tenacibaculum maritimum]MDB0602351.1 hypothetical protein [Tenacibaculum maritimum]MDB0613488.1 hypothetical protein [Tenacibaculum maritimum]
MPNHKELLSTLSKQEYYLNKIYAAMASDLSKVLKRYKINGNSKLWFKNALVKKDVEKILSKYRNVIYNHISSNVKSAWELSNNHNDSFVNKYIKGNTIPNDKLYFQRNNEALKAFLKRQSNGLDLSGRVWNLSNQTKSQLEYFIAEGLTDGRSAGDLAKDLQRYLKQPEKRFRRLRNPITGKLVLSNPAKNFHPGQGVYRSSYKNALRLARNEINIAYRTSDFERRKQLPFVTGITVHLSNAHPRYDICDELVGDYPKEFVFTGWHPNCLCYTTSKLLSKRDFIKQLKGNSIDKSIYTNTIPVRAGRFLSVNSNRLQRLNSKPHFLQDNFKNTDKGYQLKKSIGEPVFVTEEIEDSLIKGLKNIDVKTNFNDAGLTSFKSNAAGFNLNEMFSELENQLTIAGLKKISKKVYLNKDGFQFELSSRGFNMTRSVLYGKEFNSVSHDYLLLPDKVQGGGLTKKMFQSLYKQYEKGNIKKIEVHANINVGGYAWARYGFSSVDKRYLDLVVKRFEGTSIFNKVKRIVSNHYKNGNSTPFPMYKIVEVKGSKEILLGSDWFGEINLNNKDEKERFLNYLFKK